ncbi:MAG: UDP-N-acetylmuramate dehydrogenase [bacterium]
MTLKEENLPKIRGRYLFSSPLSKITWFRVGGPADVIVMPADEEDLKTFLQELDPAIPLLPVGVGSNLLIRDGGIRGVVLRLGPAFAKVDTDGLCLTAGAAALDASVAKKAARAGIAGLEFYRGIPGTIGGALRMNAGAYGGETKDFLIEAIAYDRQGLRHVLSNDDMGYSYRHCSIPDDYIFVQATFKGTAGDPAQLEARMAEIMTAREKTQPVKSRTGGSTFKNPDPVVSNGRSSWQLIDEIGGRGRVVGDAQMSELHCNFMINRGQATAADLEQLGTSIQADVQHQTGVQLHWEIKRLGEYIETESKQKGRA